MINLEKLAGLDPKNRIDFMNLLTYILKDLHSTLLSKNETYGYHNIPKFGQKGVLIRANDKLERLYNIVWLDNTNHVADETVYDTWLDLAGYALLGLMQAIAENEGEAACKKSENVDNHLKPPITVQDVEERLFRACTKA